MPGTLGRVHTYIDSQRTKAAVFLLQGRGDLYNVYVVYTSWCAWPGISTGISTNEYSTQNVGNKTYGTVIKRTVKEQQCRCCLMFSVLLPAL